VAFTHRCGGRTSIATGARPEKRSSLAAAGVTSMIRLLSNGSRSLIRTTTERPLRRLVTRTIVPKGDVRCAAVSLSGEYDSPLDVVPHFCVRIFPSAIQCAFDGVRQYGSRPRRHETMRQVENRADFAAQFASDVSWASFFDGADAVAVALPLSATQLHVEARAPEDNVRTVAHTIKPAMADRIMSRIPLQSPRV
jgi:hypothetical protein